MRSSAHFKTFQVMHASHACKHDLNHDANERHTKQLHNMHVLRHAMSSAHAFIQRTPVVRPEYGESHLNSRSHPYAS